MRRQQKPTAGQRRTPFNASAGAVVRSFAWVAAILSTSLPPLDANAQDAPLGATETWNLVLGVGAGVSPVYDGASKLKVRPVPIIAANFANRIFIGPDGFRAAIVSTGSFRAGVAFGYDLGRDQDDDDRLKGLGDIKWSVNGGGFAEFRFENILLSARIAQSINRPNYGLQAQFRAAIALPITESFRVLGGASITLADRNYMSTHFGISGVQAAASGYPEYRALAGVKDVGLSLTGIYSLAESWNIRAQIGARLLTGYAADSPLVERRLQPQFLVGVAYRF